MKLDYTTAIEQVWTKDVFRDPAGSILADAMGLQLEDACNRVILFTHPVTAMSLHRSDEAIRADLAKKDCGSKPWEDTYVVKSRSAYVRRELFKIADTWAARKCTREQAIAAGHFLFGYVRDLTLGQVTDKDGMPFVGSEELRQTMRKCRPGSFEVKAFSLVERVSKPAPIISGAMRTVQDLAIFEQHFH